jgi:linoleate 10R-lipoxygenase
VPSDDFDDLRIAARIGAFFNSTCKASYPFLSKLTETGRPIDQLIGNILGVAVGACVNYAQAAVNVVNFYLDDARTAERKYIIKLAHSTDLAADALLRGYVCEAMRTSNSLFSLLS